MDAWVSRDLLPLELGGNGKWNAVCQAAGLSRVSTADKYRSAAADVYRSKMQIAVQSETPFTLVDILTVLNLPLDNTPPPPPISPVRRHSSAIQLTPPPPPPKSCSSPNMVQLRKQASLEVKCTLCHDFVSLSALDLHSTRCASSTDLHDTYEELEFDTILGRHPTDSSTPAPLGLSLTKSTLDGNTLVSKVTPGGDADVAGVIVGSQVLGINGLKTSTFDTLMQYLSQHATTRPLAFSFRIRRPVAVLDVIFNDPTAPSNTTTCCASWPATTVGACENSPATTSLGMAVAMSVHNQCRVISVEADGAAAKHGIVVGCTIVAVNGVTGDGMTATKPQSVFDLLQSMGRARPLRLRLHRYTTDDDALIRLWSG
ncbi:hypothetical protein DYB32_008467 [Aphanomyces invadans]|uniref:PDZ domain-containing protein n=1 Tax=Aphanomyces invadans TaxID=157072 RepID=A0A418ANF6_9STRA|nr:hypothetical protein DYB32_008467 [Aphanomyces invadans]